MSALTISRVNSFELSPERQLIVSNDKSMDSSMMLVSHDLSGQVVAAEATKAAPPEQQKGTTNSEYTLGYIPALDGLRGISVMLILGYHDIGHYTSGFSHWLNAWFTVDMFFLISGYLITSILVKEERKTGSISLKNFYVRRWLRIAPAYYVCIGAAIVWCMMGGNHHLKPFAYAAMYLTNLDLAFGWNLIPLKYGVSHFWTLGVEEQFYLVWPNLMKWANKHLVKIVAAVIGAVYLWRGYLIANGADWIRIYHGFDTRVDTLMYGSLIAIALANQKVRDVARKVVGNGWVQMLILWLVLQTCVGLGHPGDGTKDSQFYLWQAKMPFVHILFSSLIMSLMLAPKAVASLFFSNPIAVWLGKLSYAIYLWHPLVHTTYCSYYWTYFNTHKLEAELIQYGLIIAVAAASYYLIEKPFLKLKSKFA